MSIRRIVPDLHADDPAGGEAFYVDVLGLDVAMRQQDIVTYAAPGSPVVQLSVVRPTSSDVPLPQVSVEVSDVDAVHARATAAGMRIVYPLTDEPWGVRRFFVLSPDGAVINVLGHLPARDA